MRERPNAPLRTAVFCLATLLPSCGGDSPTSPTDPASPPPASGFDAVAVVFYDQNGNGQVDSSEIVRLGNVVVDIGGRTARSETATGRVVVQNVPAGSYAVNVQRSSLPPYYEPGPAPQVTVPQEPGRDFAVPLRLPIGSNRPNTYLAFGDSITFGDGATDSRGWTRPFELGIQAAIGTATVIQDGVGGTTSAQGNLRLPASLRRYAPAYTLILYGTNDWNQSACNSTITTCYTGAMFQSMIDTAKAQGSLPVVSTIPPANTGYDARAPEDRNIRVEQMNEQIRAVARASGTPIAETYAAFQQAAPSGNYSTLFVDHVHPNDRGHELIAEAFVAAVLRPLSASGRFRALEELPAIAFAPPGARLPSRRAPRAEAP
jgi:lysophospholipase L1-like esterase